MPNLVCCPAYDFSHIGLSVNGNLVVPGSVLAEKNKQIRISKTLFSMK
jgi:hypothetical protein